ncbi:MAG TPA: hypothetical protein VNA20_13410 [Frankiaceae bacterium]|nr:hypothetical protein [Frankiaceae bacterium]
MTRLVRWVLFTVAIALVPFAFFWVRSTQRGASAGLADVVGGGDLYLVAAAIVAGGIGELAGARRRRQPLTLLLAYGFAVLVLLWSALLFADTAAARTSATGTGAPPPADPAAVAVMSTWVIGAAVLSGGICVGLAE